MNDSSSKIILHGALFAMGDKGEINQPCENKLILRDWPNAAGVSVSILVTAETVSDDIFVVPSNS